MNSVIKSDVRISNIPHLTSIYPQIDSIFKLKKISPRHYLEDMKLNSTYYSKSKNLAPHKKGKEITLNGTPSISMMLKPCKTSWKLKELYVLYGL